MRKSFIQGIIVALLISILNVIADVGPVAVWVQCPDVTLSWQTVPGETFTIQHRADMNSSTSWTELAELFPASVSGNTTTFTHIGGASCSGNEAAMQSSSSSLRSQFPESRPALLAELRKKAVNSAHYLSALLEIAIAKTKSGTKQWSSARQTESQIPSESETAQLAAEGTLLVNANTAFYRVFKTSPTAVADYFAIQQGSAQNQLDILANDVDPDDGVLLIASITPAAHGNLEYTSNASLFRYTPESTFFGIDTFTYTVVNPNGGTATASVKVFVSQTGNNPPVVISPVVTLPVGVYSANINPLGGATDPNGDAISLIGYTIPRLGIVGSNAGQIAYQHPNNYSGADSFDYILADSRGGMTRVSVSIRQIDTDSDGMADEWEIAYGLNPSTNNSTSDPDGDGLPDLAEFLLRTHPHSADNPLGFGIADGASVSGFVKLILPGLNPVLEAQAIILYVNGNPAPSASLSQSSDGLWSLNWDTSFQNNGSYSIKAGFQYKQSASVGEESVIFGQQKNVTVANMLRFDRLTSKFSDFLLVDATLAGGINANYRAEFYDDYGNPLVFAEGTTTDGKIQLGWDLTDRQGTQISFGSIQGKFFISNPGAPTLQNANPAPIVQWFLKEGNTSGNGFVVAWGWDQYGSLFNNNREQMMLGGVVNILGDPSSFDEYSLAPGFNVPYASAFRYDTEGDKKFLLDSLKDNRNFFWFGHGSFSGIAGNGNRSTIGTADVQKALQNNSLQSTPKHPKTDKNPYRLVIMNGCETYSSLWAGVFGIDFSSQNSSDVVLDYQFTGRSPRAFVGWTAQVLVPGNSLEHAEYGQALGELFSSWMSGLPLDVCIDFFADRAVSDGFTDQDKWKISGCLDLRRHD